MKYNVLKHSKTVLFLCATSGLLSCSDTPEQYKPSGGVGFERQRHILPDISDKASVPHGGEFVGRRPELNEEEKDQQTRKRSLLPVSYGESSAGGVSLSTTYEEAGKKLNLSFIHPKGLFVYKEGVGVVWRSDPPRTPKMIFVGGSYQGVLDFGPWMGDKRKRKIGESFVDQFTPGVKDIRQDQKAKNFIVSTYKYWEGTTEDCFQTKKCHLNINPQGNFVLVQFPKMVLLFGNNERRKLTQVAIPQSKKPSGCFTRPLDIVKTTFVCDPTDESKNITLGESYERVVEKSGINPSQLSITYDNTYLVQRTDVAVLGWDRIHWEEKKKSVPPSTPLSLVAVWNEYTSPFLVNGKRIKFDMDKQNQKISLSLEDFASSSEEEEVLPVSGDVPSSKPSEELASSSSEKSAAPSEESVSPSEESVSPSKSPVYLTTDMSVLKGNYKLQYHFIEVLLNFLEGHFQQAYEAGELAFAKEASPVASSESVPEEGFKSYKRVFGKYDDRHAPKARGVLILKAWGRFLLFHVMMDEASGYLEVYLNLLNNEFTIYALNNQKPLDLRESPKSVAGFRLGEKLYLRNKDLGDMTAIVAYVSKDSKNTLFTLADYSDEVESSVVYESGRDQNITFQLSEWVRMGELDFYIHPTGGAKNLDGKDHEEYEIIAINARSDGFFNPVQHLCSVDNLNVDMGMYDRSFTDLLVKTVHEARVSKKTEDMCPYISPQDTLFSGVKRLYFFPKNKLVLGFNNRELSFFRVYKQPPPTKNREEEL